VIRRLVRDLNLDVEIAAHPTVREADGLAMSSRNAYLDADERKSAACLFRSLKTAKTLVRSGERDASKLVTIVKSEIAKEPLARIEYTMVIDPETLLKVGRVSQPAVLVLAVRIGKTRLIDNMILRP
jgi:pantoate--beta-alanine ligase